RVLDHLALKAFLLLDPRLYLPLEVLHRLAEHLDGSAVFGRKLLERTLFDLDAFELSWFFGETYRGGKLIFNFAPFSLDGSPPTASTSRSRRLLTTGSSEARLLSGGLVGFE